MSNPSIFAAVGDSIAKGRSPDVATPPESEKVRVLRSALVRCVDDLEEIAQLEATCPECTDGQVPDRFNKGLCAWHNALAVLREIPEPAAV